MTKMPRRCNDTNPIKFKVLKGWLPESELIELCEIHYQLLKDEGLLKYVKDIEEIKNEN